jgi:TPP-dependent indolepyruvate ferredoxin oxidoreductase alpha subunit
MPRDQSRDLFRRRLPDVHFDEVGVLNQRFPGIIRPKIVQSHHVSCPLEPLAHSYNRSIGRDGFLDFEHDPGRQQCKMFHQQHVVRTVDERTTLIAQYAQANHIQRINDGASLRLGIVRNGLVFRALLK